jgi:GAF domain-containing protein/HAMP domain-containing protein
MINRFLRRLTVRSRIVGGVLALMFVSALSIPIVVGNQNYVVSRLQQVADVEERTNRLLLLASTRIESSRVNLMRYTADYAPSTYESLDDVNQATELLVEAVHLTTSPDQQEIIASLAAALTEYKLLIQNAETEQQVNPNASLRLVFQAHRLGNDIGQQIERIVRDNEARIAAANQTIYDEAQTRLTFLVLGYLIALLFALISAFLVERSITRPVAELRDRAEAFQAGHTDITIPIVGRDELSLLAEAFNQMITQSSDLISTLGQRVDERIRGMQTAADVARATTSVLDPQELLRQVVDLVRQRFDLYYVGLFLLDEKPDESGRTFAVLRAGTGKAGQEMLAQGHKLEMGGESMIGQCVARSEARVALDVGEEAVRFENPLLPKTRSELALPLRSRGRVIGAMTVQSEQANAFDEAYIVVLQTMADQVAVAIDNARLFTNAQATLAEMETIHQRYLGEAWATHTSARTVSGYEQVGTEMTPLSHDPLPQVPLAITEQRPVVWRDRDQVGEFSPTTLVVPIVLRGQSIGALGFKATETERQWSTEEVTMAEIIAEQLALAADNLRLLDDTQRRAAHERLVSDLSEQMQRATDMEDLMRIAAEGLNEALGGSRAYVRMGTATELASGNGHDGSEPTQFNDVVTAASDEEKLV